MSKEESNQEIKSELFTPSQNNKNENYQDYHIRIADEVIVKFREIVEKDAIQNLKLKEVFFYICCGILIALSLALISALNTLLTTDIPNNTLSFAAEIISIISAFVAAFMTLMRIITNNLFNAKTQESIVELLTKNK